MNDGWHKTLTTCSAVLRKQTVIWRYYVAECKGFFASLCSCCYSVSLFVAYCSRAQSRAMSTIKRQCSREVEFFHAIERTDVQWSQIKLSGSEPCVIRSSRGLFPVSQGIVIHSSNSTVMVFIGSTASNVNKESEAALHYHVATFAQ